MRFGITSRLFLAVLAANIVMALAVGFGVRAAFETGFDSYLRAREDQRLSRLVRALGNAYQERQSWEFLRGNEEAWASLNFSVRPPLPNRGFSVGPGPMEGPPLELQRHIIAGEPAGGAPPPHLQMRFFDGRREMRVPPAIVTDAAGDKIVGNADHEGEMRRRPIEAAGRTVGWLVTPERATVFDVVDQRFREQQRWAGWTVALLATILSAIVAWFLARGLLAPVRRLADATRKLADGDYTTRVVSNRKDELGHLVDDFNRLGNALEKHESSRRNFMADVSHELRTPIAVLKGELEGLQDGVRTLTPATLASLQAEVALLGKLVADLHDLSLADVGGLAYHFEAVDLSTRLADCLDAFRERFAARAIEVDRDIAASVRVRADSSRLAQVVNNLLENSVRYTDPRGRVVARLRTEGNKAVLDIQDSAPGVPDEALPRLFERLFRVESSRNRQLGGSGLGLAISRSVVEAHGGTITARASPLGGLWIEVRLPLFGISA